jgi:methyl-accepting chemotaxis protein
MSKVDGAFSGGEAWFDDQAELFDGDTWEQFGKSLSDGLSDALDFTASYIPEAYDSITKTIEDTLEDIDENSDNLTSWNWWKSEVKDTVDKTVRKVKTEVEDAGEFLDDATDVVAKLFKHKNAILNLPKQVAKGDATSVQNFVDTVLKDLDPDLSKQIKESPDFYMVLELIADHDSALTYFAYMDMFLEAVPPNFYAYISGKAGVYVLLEIVLFIVLSFLTLGVGVAARLTMLAAKMTATSVRVAKKLNHAEKAQNAVKAMVEKFSDNADTLKKLGEKLALTRSAGRSKVGFEDSTLTDKKNVEEREKKCRFCSGKHDAPESLNGWVEYR